MKKVVIADAQYLTRVGLSQLVGELEGLTVVATVADWSQVVVACQQHQADVLILDHHNLGQFSWHDLQVLLQSMPIQSIVVSDEDETAMLHAALSSGIQSFLTKNCSASEIKNALLAVLNGDKFFCNKILDLIFSAHYTTPITKPAVLSTREIEIISLLVDGLSSKAIADKLSLSIHTVYTHRKNIMRKLQLRTVQELVSHAIQEGLHTPRT